jgi:hypothetical protein
VIICDPSKVPANFAAAQKNTFISDLSGNQKGQRIQSAEQNYNKREEMQHQ